MRIFRRGVVFLAILSTLAALASFSIAASFFLAVRLNLEGAFRLRVFWFPMSRWLLLVIFIALIWNTLLIAIFMVVAILRQHTHTHTLQIQKQPRTLRSSAHWQRIWFECALLLSVLSGYLLNWSPTFSPQEKTELMSIAMVSSTEGWAVGDFQGGQAEGVPHGVIWHYYDGRWTQAAQLADEYLNGVAALPDGEAWAVGSDNTILHEQGGNWTLVHRDLPDVASVLTQVAMVSPTEGWAVGYSSAPNQSGGTIWHWSQGKWVQIPYMTRTFLWHISTLPDGEAWTVGNGGILHEYRGTWSQIADVSQYGINDVFMLSPTEGWATGDHLLHFQHGTWTLFSQTAPFISPYRIAMSSSHYGWGIINDRVLHYTQGTWQQVDISISAYLHNINDITMVPGDPSEGWMVGAGAISDTNTLPPPTILHMKNGIWSVFPL
jgi:hypothetical protein